MKLSELITAREILMNHSNDKLAFPTSYKIMKMLKATEDDVNFYREKMSEIIETYGEKDADGKTKKSEEGFVKIQNGMKEECNTKIRELEETKVNECSVKFSLGELSNMQFSVNELFILENFIQQE